MRLISFYIKEFRVLKDVRVDFTRANASEIPRFDVQQGYNLDFLVGVNGTGKSTLLRLLARVFSQLRTQNYSFPVGFELQYTIQNRFVRITNIDFSDPAQSISSQFTWSEKAAENDDWGEPNDTGIRRELLPKHIVIYTTGGEEVWLRDLFAPTIDSIEQTSGTQTSDDIYLQELPGHRAIIVDDETTLTIDPDDPFLFIQSGRLPLVTLCGLIASAIEEEQVGDNPLEKVLIAVGLKTPPKNDKEDRSHQEVQEGFIGFSLRLRSYPDLTLPIQRENIDKLSAVADRRIQQGSDKLLVFNMAQQLEKFRSKTDETEPVSIFDVFGEPIELFQQLHVLYEHQNHYDPPLQQVNIFLRPSASKKNSLILEENTEVAPSLMLFDWLSDGERSFLSRMALFALFDSGNLLIMLDEPEVHFNDVWKREIVNILDGIMRVNDNDRPTSHALITTHSSIALTDVRQEDILVLHKRTELEEGQEAISKPNIITLGADPSDILVHVFGSRSSTGERSINFIRDRIGQSNTVEELQALKEIVAHGYWRYRIELEAKRISS